MADGLDATECARLLATEKDAGMGSLHWHETKVGGGVVMGRLPEIGLAVNPVPSEGHLLMSGQWKGPNDVQLFLQILVNSTQRNLARLCWNRHHQADLHWHWYLTPDGREQRESVSDPPSTVDNMSMMLEVFVPRLQITNYQASLT